MGLLNQKASKWQMCNCVVIKGSGFQYYCMHFSPRTCIIAWITNGATRAELLSSFSYTCDNLSTFFASMGNEEARKGKKGEKQSIKRTHENGLSFEANDDRADLLSNEQHLKARLSSILSYKIGLKRLQKRLIKKASIILSTVALLELW